MKAVRRIGFVMCVVFLLIAGFVSVTLAQQLSLSGVVRDETGVVAGATVTLTVGGREVAKRRPTAAARTDSAGSRRAAPS